MKQVRHNLDKILSLEEANQVLYNIAIYTITRDNKQSEFNEKILEIKTKYEPDILALNAKIKSLAAQLDTFLKSNKKLFKDKRSCDLTYGRIGFRTGKNAVKRLNNQTWQTITEKFSNLFGTKYAEVKFKLNKNKIISDAENGILSAEQLATVGCKVSKGETTFYDIFKEKINVESLD